MTARLRSGVALLALAVAQVACSGASPSPSVHAAPLRGEASDDEFTLVITSTQAEWAANDGIEVQADLSYGGALPAVKVGGAAGGVIGFSVLEMNGNRRMDALRDMACFEYTIGPDQPITTPYAKSGAINPGEPNEAFYKQFFADPLFHLPPGAWRIEAWAQLYFGPDCGGRKVDLRASLLVNVQ